MLRQESIPPSSASVDASPIVQRANGIDCSPHNYRSPWRIRRALVSGVIQQETLKLILEHTLSDGTVDTQGLLAFYAQKYGKKKI